MKKSVKSILVVALCLMMSLVAVAAYSEPVYADAGKGAVKFLKGKWYSNSMSENGPSFYVKFTKKYAKYYTYDSKKGKYVYSSKSKIKSAKKSGKGYLIKLKNKNGKFCYKTVKGDKNALEYYGTWKSSEYGSTYSGSSSLSRW